MIMADAGIAAGKKKYNTSGSKAGMPDNIRAIVNKPTYAPKPSPQKQTSQKTSSVATVPAAVAPVQTTPAPVASASSGGGVSTPTFSFNQTKPTYTSRYQEKIDSMLDKILNREKFSYDFNADPLYQQYKEQYTKLGNEAGMNAVANAAAMSGGFGNSYGVTAASQANQQYLGELNDVIPQLYEAALSKYQSDAAADFDAANLTMNAENMDYGKYRDTVADYYQDYANAYQMYRDGVADSQFERNFNLSKESNDSNIAYNNARTSSVLAEMNRNNAASAAKLSAYGLSGQAKKSSKSSENAVASPEGLTNAQRISIRNELEKMPAKNRANYIANLYDRGEISESNLYWFQRMFDL